MPRGSHAHFGAGASVEEADIVLEVCDARKSFGYFSGLGGVDLTLRRGEILAVLGDYGAGKSTLIKAVSGSVLLDSGQILLNGIELTLKSPAQARARGSRLSSRTSPSSTTSMSRPTS